MSELKRRLLTNWHMMRVLRLVIGAMLLITGFQAHDWVTGLFSTFFIYQAVTDTGCCGSGGCYTGNAKTDKPLVQTTEEITEYEEIK